MKRYALIASVVAVLTVATVTVIWGRSSKPNPTAAALSRSSDWLVAGPGRVEPNSEDIKLAAEISGKLKIVLVEEGDSVKKGQILAELVNGDYRAQVESAEAEVQRREAEKRKAFNGARREERLEALSNLNEAEAVMKNAESEANRHQQLFSAGVIAQTEADRYTKEYEVAKAQYEAKLQSHKLVVEDTREEDRSVAVANLQSAQANLEQARALLAKTFIRSPIDGTVLRRYHRTGESVSNGATTPDPIFTIGETRTLRVRIDVDEADVNKLTLGQKAYVTADAYGDQRFWGHVVRIGRELGRKNVRTDEPTEHVDTKILETLVQLDDGVNLPVGLRVNAYLVASDASTANKSAAN